MRYHSTRDAALTASAGEAILRGLAPDGGLYVPESLPAVGDDTLARWRGLAYPALAAEILALFLTDYDPAFLREAAAAAYGAAFGGKAGLVEKVHEGLYALELWHGPTCAFKDYALQLMPRLLVQAKAMLHRTETTRILVATSGDTGKAALAGYADLPGIDIAVFYPDAGTSEIQRLQMATQRGENVAVYAVKGNFDDAQTGVKRVFADADAAAELEARGIRLSSANSINWGRLVPQIVYYFHAYFRMAERGAVAWGEPVDVCVPTGNFGDILAGWYAKKMGLPLGRLLCASNKNNVLSDFISTGTYDARRRFYKTASPSMDILISSNLERLLYHACGDTARVAGWLAELGADGCYTVDGDTLAAIRADFACGWADDAAAAAELRARFEADGYLADPHTAVALRVAARQKGAAPMLVLSTASPCKFPRDVLAALGAVPPDSDFDAMAALERLTGTQAPPSLAALRKAPVRFAGSIDPAAIRAAALR